MSGFRTSQDEEITGINVTPLVDISLVLLIIFMVTSTIMVNPSIKVSLPRAATAQDSPKSAYGLVITKDGELFLNGKRTTRQEAEKVLKRAVSRDPKTQVLISADRDLKYQKVIDVIELVKKAGVVDFALNVETQ